MEFDLNTFEMDYLQRVGQREHKIGIPMKSRLFPHDECQPNIHPTFTFDLSPSPHCRVKYGCWLVANFVWLLFDAEQLAFRSF